MASMNEEQQGAGLPVSPSVTPEGAQGTGQNRGLSFTDTDLLNWLEVGHWDVLYRSKGVNSGGVWWVGAEESYFEASGRTLRECLTNGIIELFGRPKAYPAIQSPTSQQESKKGTQGGQSSEE